MHKYRRMIFIAIVAILTIAVSGISTAVAQDGVVWQGSYYNNANRQGTPTFTRSDNSINFNWGNGAPGNLNNDNFSVEWVTQTYLAAGNYRFSLLADDYARIAIDGNAIINTFETGQLDEIVEAEVSLGAGNHTINVVYQELIGPAFITVNWTPTGVVQPPQPDPTPGTWTAEYFNNANLAGNRVIFTTEADPTHFWGGGAPYAGLPADNFSARWTRPISDPGSYEVSVNADDGVRVYIDNTLLINEWHPATGVTYEASFNVNTNQVRSLTVEYFESTGSASLDFDLARFGGEQGNWTAQYYDNTTLTGEPVYTTTLSTPSQNWGTGSPAANVPANNFSARFRSDMYLEAGTHRFQVQSDDGVRVYVDGNLIIDEFHASAAQLYQADVTLNAGFHSVIIDYYEAGGAAYLIYERNLIGGDVAPGPDPADPVATAAITTGTLNVRNAPSTTNGDVITRVNYGETYGVVGRTTDSTWWQIVLDNGATGWVFGRYVNVDNPGAVPATDQDTRPDLPSTGYVIAADGYVNVRAQPARGSALLAVMDPGDTGDILARNLSTTWWLIDYEGVTGWVSAGLVNDLSGIDVGQVPIE